MSKKYFTKYLPVEGEIFNGDKFINPKNNTVETAQIPEDFNNPHASYYEGYQKVNLFLCSKDIEIGDIVKFDVLGNGVYTDFRLATKDKEDDIDFWGLDSIEGSAIAAYFPHIDEEAPIKVMGEVSSDAIWVKEGDEFDEGDVFLQWRCLDCEVIWNDQSHGAWSGCIKGYSNYYLIVNPSCKYFH